MKKTFLITLLFLFAILVVKAQEDTTYWKKNGKIGLNFSQSYLSNWAAGGQSAFNTKGMFNYTANYAKDNNKWDNILDMTYGLSIIGQDKPMKTDDKIASTVSVCSCALNCPPSE